MNRHYNRLRRAAAWLLGFTFLMSGIMKLMDPTGSEMVMRAYFSFMHLTALNVLAKAAGVGFALLEAVIGAALVSGVWRKAIGIASCALTGFFTLLTLILVIFNPTMDCGCFGEAVHLTHLQTFIKNIVLCILCCTAFIPMRDLGVPRKSKYAAFGITVCSLAAFMTYSLISLPLRDYTDFRAGATLAAAVNDTDAGNADSYSDVYSSVFVYEKDGVSAEFTLEDLPDSSWTYVETRIEAQDDGFPTSPVLSITDAEGHYCDSIAAQGTVLIVSEYKNVGRRKMARINGFIGAAEEAGLRVIHISPDGDTPYHADFKALASLNRSNGGVTFIDDGLIFKKWPYRSLAGRKNHSAAIAECREAISGHPDEILAVEQTRGSLALQGFLLYVFAMLMLL